MRLDFSYDINVQEAYVIYLPGNDTSEILAKRCATSCEDVGMPYKMWDAYDGTSGEIHPPAHHNAVLDLLKQVDKNLSITEVACALSHISLWAQCVLLDRPIVVLEHDAVMVQPYLQHAAFNSIVYLGAHEQVNSGWQVLPIPPHASNGCNYHFICRAHAYAIDPAVAKNMLAHVIKYGICESLDIMLRADIFPIQQRGMYAYDMPGQTTITDRKKAPDGGER